ncbi:MAG TPA: hypothetical protein VKP13_16100 [Nitrospira sp.]|nr:hypothetical protein [Nitrospira sp.]
MAQGPTETTASLIALKTYLNEECDVAAVKSAVCGVKRLITYKNDAALKKRLLQILTDDSDQETLQMAKKVVDQQWEVFQRVAKKSDRHSGPQGSGTTGAATSTMTKEAYSKHHLDRILRIYEEKAAMGLATIDPEEASRALTEAAQRGDQALADILRFALVHHP